MPAILLPSHCRRRLLWSQWSATLWIQPGGAHVDGDRGPRRRGSVSARHDCDDRRLEGSGRFRAAHRACKAAATPVRGALWGAIATLIVQSSSATTMTTIGLVSAGLLTFPQGLGLVFGA